MNIFSVFVVKMILDDSIFANECCYIPLIIVGLLILCGVIKYNDDNAKSKEKEEKMQIGLHETEEKFKAIKANINIPNNVFEVEMLV